MASCLPNIMIMNDSMFFQVLACLELLESLPLQQAERYAHELVTWLSGILEKDQSDEQVRLTRFMFCHFCSLKVPMKRKIFLHD